MFKAIGAFISSIKEENPTSLDVAVASQQIEEITKLLESLWGEEAENKGEAEVNMFPQPQREDRSIDSIFLWYLQKAVAEYQFKLVKKILDLYLQYQPHMTDAAQEKIWNQLIPVMRSHNTLQDTTQKQQHEKIFTFLVLHWGTGILESVLMTYFLGQHDLRTYLGTFIPDARKDFLQQLLGSDIAKQDKGNLVQPLLLLIMDYLIYLPPTDILSSSASLLDRKPKIVQPVIPAHLSAVAHSPSTTSLLPSPEAPKTNTPGQIFK